MTTQILFNQPEFNHPELFGRIIPSGWVLFGSSRTPSTDRSLDAGDVDDAKGRTWLHYRSTTRKDMKRTVILDENGKKFEELFYLSGPGLYARITYPPVSSIDPSDDPSAVPSDTEFFFEGTRLVCYRRMSDGNGGLEEEWIDETGKTIADRRTHFGVLSGNVRILRPNGFRREEKWLGGILQSVQIIDLKAMQVLLVQSWDNGKHRLDYADFRRKDEFHERDVLLLSSPPPIQTFTIPLETPRQTGDSHQPRRFSPPPPQPEKPTFDAEYVRKLEEFYQLLIEEYVSEISNAYYFTCSGCDLATDANAGRFPKCDCHFKEEELVCFCCVHLVERWVPSGRHLKCTKCEKTVRIPQHPLLKKPEPPR